MADNKNIQKIFSLTDYRKFQLTSNIPEKTRETYREYGYFGGASPNRTRIERLDYSNDLVIPSIRGNLNFQRLLGAATGNSNFGYFGGGYAASARTNIDRLNYSNDTTTTTVGNLFTGGYRMSATGNSNFGYFYGGIGRGSILDRISYSNDSATALLRGTLTFNRSPVGATGTSNFGYFSGGRFPRTSITDRINYSNDLVSALARGFLTSTRGSIMASSNSQFGYFAGGSNPSVLTSTIDRLNYANDTANAVSRGPLTSITDNPHNGTGNSNFGYYAIGNNLSTSNRIDYSNDTQIASIRSNFTQIMDSGAATSSHSFGGSPNSSYASNFTFPTVPNAGYFGGGNDGTNVFASIDKVDYTNDTATASVRSALSSARYSLAATGNGSFGYYAGGRPAPASPDVSTIDRIEYASDTQNAVVRSTLNNAVRLLAAAGNSNFGYFGGGFPARNGVDRLDYSSDTTATSPRQGLPLATYSLAATGNSNFGYFAGGLTASPTTNRSEIYRVNYSNDSTIPQNRGPLSEAKRELSATGNSNFGYYSAAQNPGLSPSLRTQIERLDYSNDTLITSVRSILSLARFGTGATGNSNFGYFGAGTNGPTYFSTVDRINYSNDTAIASIRGPLSTKAYQAATSPLAYGGAPIYFTNPLPQVFQDQIEFNDRNTLDLPFKRVLGSFGYFGGGMNPASSRVDRIDYSNDSATASVRGSLTSARGYIAATGNSNFGYFGGNPSPLDRIDYSNDASTAIFRGSVVARSNLVATGNSNFGYFGGGDGPLSRVDRISYSNDSTTASVRGPLSLAKILLAATGNSNFGYFGGGDPGPRSTVDRINYSNDTQIALVRGSLTLARGRLSATGNLNFGYFGGGGSPPHLSIIERIDYSNDLATASLRGLLSAGKWRIAATSNSDFAWFSGGDIGGLGTISRVDRIDYSNDTATASVRGPLSLARYALAASTNARNS